MDGRLTPLEFPVVAPPRPGEALAIAPGVWWLRMPLPFALDHINLWLLEDGPGWAIVDTGYATAETKGLWEQILTERLRLLPVTRVIVTHYHPDHIGLADWLTRRCQVPLWITEKEWLYARVMSQGADDLSPVRRSFARSAGLDETASEIFEHRQNSYRRGVPSVPPSFQRLQDGTAVEIGGRGWRVVVGEGHAPELACFYCAETGVLIAGDQVLPKISPNISVQAHEPDDDPLAATCRRWSSCGQRSRRTRWFCRHTTFRSSGCMPESRASPRTTRRAAMRLSPPARCRRARCNWCRFCFGAASIRIRWVLRLVNRLLTSIT